MASYVAEIGRFGARALATAGTTGAAAGAGAGMPLGGFEPVLLASTSISVFDAFASAAASAVAVWRELSGLERPISDLMPLLLCSGCLVDRSDSSCNLLPGGCQ